MTMEPQEQRKRKPNWIEDENVILLEEYGKWKNILPKQMQLSSNKSTQAEDVARNYRQCYSKASLDKKI